jgi:putative chitinase
MVDRGIFFARARAGKLLGPTLTQSEVDGCTAILDAMMGAPLAYVAYALATAYLETAHTMQPIEEFGGPAYFFRMYDKAGNRPAVAAQLGNTMPGDGVKYHGRGYVQLTGRANYSKATAKLGVDLVNHPELAWATISPPR